ncbi:formyltransferase family protein [Cohnella suwonensis]|uniref:phosphoribosylglycinamide formyltransferase 1 n=1 Tax=Cohnella suwonensis TaxID=696072 RepID=A0ABW0LYT7_9BACL
MKVGILGSAGGSVFAEVVGILKAASLAGRFQFYVITDRECGLETKCADLDIEVIRIEERDNALFSEKAGEHFHSIGIDMVLLFFSRLVCSHLYLSIPTFNIHPSLLPSFKGFHAVTQMKEANAKFFGASLHLVDESIDGGAIVAQVSMPVPYETSLEKLYKYSFIQKIYLALLAIELVESGAIRIAEGNAGYQVTGMLPYTDRCNPSIRNEGILREIMGLQDREGVELIK